MYLPKIFLYLVFISSAWPEDNAPSTINCRNAFGYISGPSFNDRGILITNRDSRTHNSDKSLPHSWFDMEKFKGKRILDLGSGPKGTWVNELRDNGIDAVAVDPEILPNSSDSFLIRGNAQSIPLPSGSFDMVYSMTSVFSHNHIDKFSDQELVAALREVKRVLKDRGKARLGPFSSYITRQTERLRSLAHNLFAIEIVPIEQPSSKNPWPNVAVELTVK
jgi:SAM-dependent methyltransferase